MKKFANFTETVINNITTFINEIIEWRKNHTQFHNISLIFEGVLVGLDAPSESVIII